MFKRLKSLFFRPADFSADLLADRARSRIRSQAFREGYRQAMFYRSFDYGARPYDPRPSMRLAGYEIETEPGKLEGVVDEIARQAVEGYCL